MAAASLGQTARADTQTLAVLRTWRDFDVHAAIERGDRQLRAKDGFPRGQVRVVDEIVAFDLEVGMFGKSNPQEQVARSTAPYPSLSAPREAELLAVGNPRWNPHLILLGFVDAPRAATSGADTAVAFASAAAVVARDAALDRDSARGAFHRFFKSDHNVALDVFPALGQIVGSVRCV